MTISNFYRKSGLLIFTLFTTLLVSEIILDADLVKTDMLQLNTIKADSLFMSDSILVDGFSMDFNDYFLHSTPVLFSDTEYSMTVSGNYQISSTSGLDAAFYYCYYDCLPCNINDPCDSPIPDERVTFSLRPLIDTFNINHTYYYSFMGADTSMVFEFFDGGGYGDNSGSLDINIYEPINRPYIEIDSSELYLNTIGSGIVMRSLDGTCWKIIVDNNGNMSSTEISCPD